MSHGQALLEHPQPVTLTPYARRFNGSSDQVRFGHGAITAMGYGTIACLVRFNVDAAQTPLVLVVDSGGQTLQATARTPAADAMIDVAGYDIAYTNVSSTPTLKGRAADGWTIHVMTKASGTVTPTFYKYPIGGSWTNESGDIALPTPSPGATCDTVLLGVYLDPTYGPIGFLNGDIALVAVWPNVVLTGTQVQTLDDSQAAWSALSPTWWVAFNQSSVGAGVSDLSGGGGHQSSISGTSVVSDGPPLPGYGS